MTRPRRPEKAETTVERSVWVEFREFVADALGLRRLDVGGWEIVSDARNITLALYGYNGKFAHRPRMIGSQDSYVAQLNIRSGSAPIAENEMYAAKNQLAMALTSFTHPMITGVTASDWSFDTGKNKGEFTNVVEVSGAIGFVTRPTPLLNDSESIPLAEILFKYVRQADD